MLQDVAGNDGVDSTPYYVVKIDTTPIVRGNLRDQGMAFSKLVLAGIMSPNDARHYLGLPPVAGLDEPRMTMPGGASAAVGPDNEEAEGDANA